MTEPSEPALTAGQRAHAIELVRADNKIGNVRALRQAGLKGTRGEIHALIDDDFAAELREARGYGNTTIRNEIVRRAIEGVDEPVFWQGEIVGHVRKYSDRLLARMADAYLPEYRAAKQRLEITGANGGPVQVEAEGRAVVGLADVVRLARELGLGDQVGLDGPDPAGELPAAGPVRPDPAAD